MPYGCWNASDGGYIAAWMKGHGIGEGDFAGLQSYFEQRVVQSVRTISGGRKRTVLCAEREPNPQSPGQPESRIALLGNPHPNC